MLRHGSVKHFFLFKTSLHLKWYFLLSEKFWLVVRKTKTGGFISYCNMFHNLDFMASTDNWVKLIWCTFTLIRYSLEYYSLEKFHSSYMNMHHDNWSYHSCYLLFAITWSFRIWLMLNAVFSLTIYWLKQNK